jgi:hypothetical protein
MASAWARHSAMVEQLAGGDDPAIVVLCVVLLVARLWNWRVQVKNGRVQAVIINLTAVGSKIKTP